MMTALVWTSAAVAYCSARCLTSPEHLDRDQIATGHSPSDHAGHCGGEATQTERKPVPCHDRTCSNQNLEAQVDLNSGPATHFHVIGYAFAPFMQDTAPKYLPGLTSRLLPFSISSPPLTTVILRI